MIKPRKKFETVDEYISYFPIDVQKILEKIRSIIQTSVPNAKEEISYQIPSFKINNSYLIYFAAYKNHIGLYPIPPTADEYNKKLSLYRFSKSTIRLPLSKPIPYDLIKNIVEFSLKENLKRTKKD